ncbi:unnamed protein product [Plasmodium vivax]|uniref:(malaria parasite P. vivax) hypothetical protein n=1 Tax=Plasmodium vivax TaxID=5855 RepID=A0A8S4HGE7_PLAVI|nr:unnamed protein product [Plasmodium vivax]
MAYHLFKRLQKASTSKESKPKNESRTEDIERWLKDIHDVVDKDIVQDENNERPDDAIPLSDYLSVVNQVVKYTENVKSGRNSKGEIVAVRSGTNERKEQSDKINDVDLEDEHVATSRIKNFCKLMGVITVFERLRSGPTAAANANANASAAPDREETRRRKADLLEQNGVWSLLEEIILNSAEYLNKIICLDKDMFQKKNVKINCNKLKRYVNYLNVLFEGANNGQLLFRIFHFQLESSTFIIYELVLLLQKLYIYDNVNFYFYVHHNVAFSNDVSSPYYYNLYALRCFQILFHDGYANNAVHSQGKQKIVQKVYEQYMRILHNLRKRKFFYPHLISYPFNCSEAKLSYKSKNEHYYINEKDEFCSIKSGKKFGSALFLHEEDAEIKRRLKKLHHAERWGEFQGQYDSCSAYSASSDEQSTSDNALQGKGSRTLKEKGLPKSDGASSSARLPSSCSAALHEAANEGKQNGSNGNSNENGNANSNGNRNDNRNDDSGKGGTPNGNPPPHTSTDEDNSNEESCSYFSSDISNDFITVNEEMEEEKKKKKKKIPFCEENICLIMHREGKIQNVRSTIDKLILSKNQFLSKLLAIIDSNEDAYLINEVILLLLLVAEYNGEVRNIITYERFIETVMRIIQDEHAYLFRPTGELYFLYDDCSVVVPSRKTRISPRAAANRGGQKGEEVSRTGVRSIEVGATATAATATAATEVVTAEVAPPQGEGPQSEQPEMEIYLDNITINVDLKSSLLLLKCLIISSEFGLKYVYELNIFEQFIKLVLNMYNVIIYICKNDMRKFFPNSIFILNIFLDVLASSCKVDGVNNSYTGLSCKKFLHILQKERFFESSFFFFFKFMCIYMEKYAKGGRRADQLGHHRNENSSSCEAGSENLMAVEFSRVGNEPLPGGSNSVSLTATASANVSASASSVFPTSDSGGGQLGSNPVGASIGSNFAGSSQTGSGPAGGPHAGSSAHSESEQIMRTFNNTHFVGILNMCCKFLFQDESLCVGVLLTSFAVSTSGEESSQWVDKQDEVNSFVEASLKQKNYFHLEQVLTYYMQNLKQIRYADLLLLMFLYDRKRLFCNAIYEFFLLLGGKHPQVGKYLVEALLSRRTIFSYCVMHTARRASKMLLKLKRAFHRGKKLESKSLSKNSDELAILGVSAIPQKEKFFLKYMNQSELLLMVCNLVSGNNPAGEFLKSEQLNFEQMLYYSTLLTRHYDGVWKSHLQKANERFGESVLTFRINSILFGRTVKGEVDSLKFLLPLLSNKWGSKKNSCLICVYIAVYLFKSNEEKEKKKIVKMLMQNDLFNVMYNCLNRFCRFTFDEKFFFFVSFEKSKDAQENVRSISHLRRQKYFFNYSREFSIFCIHFAYSNFVHHGMLTYIFEQSKSCAYRGENPGRRRSGYPVKSGFSLKRSHSGGDAECVLSESDGGESSQDELDGRGSQSDDWSEDDRHVGAPNRKRCEDYSPDEDHHSSASSREEATHQTRVKNKSHHFYSTGKEKNERSDLKSKAMKIRGEGRRGGRKNDTQSVAHISEEVNQLREKLNEQEVTHLEEKIYLNKIIEKKNDIINNLLYSYSVMKEKYERVESELVQLKSDVGLKEKEHQLVATNDVDELKAQHIRALRDCERVGSEKRELEMQFEKLTDLLIFLYENVAACRQYMQNVEDINVFKNSRMDANRGGDPPQPNCAVHEVKGSADSFAQPNDQLNRGGDQLANGQVWGQHSGGVYANYYNPAQQQGGTYSHPQQQSSTYSHPQQQGNPYSPPQQQSSTYSYSNQQMDPSGAYGYPPEPMQQARMYGDPSSPAEGNSSQRVCSEVYPPVTQPPPDQQYEQQYGQSYGHSYGQSYEQAPQQMYNQLYFQTNPHAYPHVYPHMYVESSRQNVSGSNAELNVSAGDHGPNCEQAQGQPNEQNCPAEFTGQ